MRIHSEWNINTATDEPSQKMLTLKWVGRKEPSKLTLGKQHFAFIWETKDKKNCQSVNNE